MAYFVISYDLHNQRNYEPVWNLLDSWGAVRLLESLWLLDTEASAKEVRDGLKHIVDDDDSIVAIELKTGSLWAGQKAKPEGINWLRQNIHS